MKKRRTTIDLKRKGYKDSGGAMIKSLALKKAAGLRKRGYSATINPQTGFSDDKFYLVFYKEKRTKKK